MSDLKHSLLGLLHSNNIVNEIKVNKQQEYTLLKTIRQKIDGGFIWEYDAENDTLTKAKYEYSTILDLNKGPVCKKIITSPNMVYINALNKKNAIKKLLKHNIVFHTIK